MSLSLTGCDSESNGGSGDSDNDILYVAIGASDAVGIGAIPLNNGYVFRIRDRLEDESFDVNFKVPFILSKEFSVDMTKKKWGRLIFIGSSSSYLGFPGGSIYSSSKHAILGLSRSLQSELKSKNIRVQCFSPSSTKTEMAKISADQDFSTF